MPALWEPQQEAQFQLDIYCNLPFTLAPIDYQHVPCPVPSIRQKSIAERHEREERERERERERRVQEASSRARRAALEHKEAGHFTMRSDGLAPRGRHASLLRAETFYGTGMLEHVPGEPGREAVSGAIRATMPHEGLDFLPHSPGPADAHIHTQTHTDSTHNTSTSTSPTHKPAHKRDTPPHTYERNTPWAAERQAAHEAEAAALRARKDRERESERRMLAGLDPLPEPLPNSWADGPGSDYDRGHGARATKGSSAAAAGGAGDGGVNKPQAQASSPEHRGPGPPAGDLASSSVSTHIASARASMAAKIKRDADALLFSLRMRYIENASRMDGNTQGVGDSAPF